MSTDPSSLNDDLERWYARFDADHEQRKRGLIAGLPDIYPLGKAEEAAADIDQDLDAWYAQYDQDHTRLKRDLLAHLPESYPQASVEHGRPRWSAHPLFRLAACLLMLLTTAILLSSWMSRPAYALQDVFDRFLRADRLYLRGEYHVQTRDIVVPIEMYLERPNRFWSTYIHRRNGNMLTGRRASDGDIRYLVMDEEPAPEWVTEDLPSWAAIELEEMAAMTISRDFFDGDASQFAYLGSESYRGRQCDIYVRRSAQAMFSRLYVDQLTLSPLRAVTYYVDKQTGQETTVRDFDQIVIEPIEVPAHIDFHPPDAAVAPLPSPIDRFSLVDEVNGHSIHIPLVLDIDRQAVVICWATAFPPGTESTVEEATFSLAYPDGTDADSAVVQLGETYDGKTTWNWLLIKATDRQSRRRAAGSVHARIRVQWDDPQSAGYEREFYRLPIQIDRQMMRELLNSFSSEEAGLTLANIQAYLRD